MDRPILFNGDMVRAVLDGRKTQTRRIVKPQPVEWRPGSWSWPAAFTTEKPYPWTLAWHEPHRPETIGICPFGKASDRLWVRETWALEDAGLDGKRVIWQADRAAAWTGPSNRLQPIYWLQSDYKPARWRPSIHMPRWASRLTLDVVSVRVERLQDISEADALAEGFASDAPDAPFIVTARDAFRHKWLDLYGHKSWDANPWVWVVAFRKSEGGR